MKTEKIKLVFGEIEDRKRWCASCPHNSVDQRRTNRTSHMNEFKIGDKDVNGSILEPYMGAGCAQFKIKLIKKIPKGSEFERYFYKATNHNNIDRVGCFYALGRRLKAICDIDGPYADILYRGHYYSRYPILSYRYIDDDHGKLTIYDKTSLGFKKIHIDAVVSKNDLFEAFYVGFIKQIIKYYEGHAWFGHNGGYRGNPESNLYTFFCKRIDSYLKSHGVKDIDKLVQKAKDKIKADLLSIYEEWDEDYDHIIY